MTPQEAALAEVARQFRDLMFTDPKEATMPAITTQNYGQFAWRTAKILPPTAMLVHGALGLLTEVSELAEANVVLKTADYVAKELGDIVWFCNYIHTSRFGGFINLDVAVPDRAGSSFSQDTFGLLTKVGEVGTVIKAYAFYDKPLNDDDLRGLLQDVIEFVRIMSYAFSLKFTDILQLNIDKLALRYPDKYTDAAAIARADEAADAGADYVNQD